MAAHEPITGGCLCGQVRYTISFPTEDTWPPNSHVCQCTQCRKASGSLISPFLKVPTANITWSRPDLASLPLEFQSSSPPSPFRQFQSSHAARRGFCGNCGSTLTFWNETTPEEFDIATGTVDEKWLIGDRTERVSSEELTIKGKWAELCKEEGQLGKEIAEPKAGCSFFTNAIIGVTDQGVLSRRWIENREKGLQIPD